MSILVIPEPIGIGTAHAESLGSVMKRTARLYQVKNARLLRLLLVGTGTTDVTHSYNKVNSWLGGAKLSRNLVEGIQQWSGRDLGQIALASQRAVLGTACSLLAERTRVCPACAEENTGSDYEMLCHQMKYVTHCPLHGCLLNESCLACGKFFRPYQWVAKGAKCIHCATKFGGQYRQNAQESNYEKWCEAQALDFVEHTTSSEFVVECPGWMERFRTGLLTLAKSSMEGYLRHEREFVREDFETCKGVPFAKLLKVSSMQACSVVELIRKPEEALSPRLPVLGGVVTPRVRRTVLPPDLLARVEKRLEALLTTDTEANLPSKRFVFREFGLECNRMWRMYPRLSAIYSAERVKRRKLKGEALVGKAVLEAKLLLKVVLHFEVPVSISVITSSIRDACEVPRQAAVDGVRIALSELAEDVRAQCKGHRSRTSVSSSQLGELRARYMVHK